MASADGLVAGPAHGLDVLGCRRIALDLRPETLDRHVDEPRIAEIVVAPDPIEQDVPRQDLSGVAGQLHEQVELGPGEGDLGAVANNGPAGDVDRQRTESETIRLVRFTAGSAERGADAGNELRDLERLLDVVVGAGYKAVR